MKKIQKNRKKWYLGINKILKRKMKNGKQTMKMKVIESYKINN